MPDSISLFTLLSSITLALLVGAFACYFHLQRRVSELRETNATLRATLEAERHAMSEKMSALEGARAELTHTFSALAGQALRSNTEEFLKLAQENLKQFQIKAESGLTQKEKAIEGLVQPIREALEKTEKQIHQIELERREAYGSLGKHLEQMAHAHQTLQSETRNLTQALRRPEVRGQWGEMTLKRLAELAGMVEYCDFSKQEHTATENGAVRPDMIVRMPDGREIVVDAKTPLDAYLSAVEAPDDAARDKYLQQHARKVAERVKELAGKAYWSQFPNAPDFVVLFIPGDQFLSAALDVDRDLLENALRQKVILATPTSFVALLRAVAYGWRQQSLAANAEKIRDLGAELYERLATFTEHFSKVGANLKTALDFYNKAAGSYDRMLIPSARKFVEMGIQANKPLESPTPIEAEIRTLANPAKNKPSG